MFNGQWTVSEKMTCCLQQSSTFF